MKINRSINMLHPLMVHCVKKIQSDIIDVHSIPIKIFETGRDHNRQEILINKGKTKDLLSKHLYNLENTPPLYATAVDYVYYDGRWSWNLRDSTISSWYNLFGNLVMDMFPEIQWMGLNRKHADYCHFELSNKVVIASLKDTPCVVF